MNQEDQIIRDVLAGNADLFRWLIERYQVGVFHMIADFINNRDAAEDLTQEVFIAAYEKLSSHDSMRCKFSTWLWTIARNKSINYLRRRKRKQQPTHSHHAPQTDPGQALCKDELYQQLDRALNELPRHQKRAFVLAEFQQMPYEEIAQIECISIGTVRSRIHRAKKKLRSLMDDKLS